MFEQVKKWSDLNWIWLKLKWSEAPWKKKYKKNGKLATRSYIKSFIWGSSMMEANLTKWIQ